ncbi:hypothetical protein BST27_23625 [Mycobacterium intermedium]|uniref:DUF732 domain-containing protein n=1 Tax=Mycobacterium intermedium TaxID=28445 RepID=A0A1E3S6Y4_MYCIE|nr:DUF732 domain-containing protein [Mycobacterium intermedium]MCV6962731.1 DUF732 domain-containing protein [Mycobacterium intermedium]ODQ97860.1 hypothetical protein BHQ20_24730 [Mycobacterium intermedium]OPE48398.1 hypothetical protein BV508_18135 [Mycobacterium intermedium]ORA96961.1 hypothetical protein BST27_23625 [Mycobacterium intermedium]
MSRKAHKVMAGLAISTVFCVPTAHAEPGPGSGETFFVEYMTRAFTPPVSEAAARAIIPVAELVCEAKARGETDQQAANIVLADNAVVTLGLSTGSSVRDEPTALEVVNAATLAYCPQYNPTLSAPGLPMVPGEVT